MESFDESKIVLRMQIYYVTIVEAAFLNLRIALNFYYLALKSDKTISSVFDCNEHLSVAVSVAPRRQIISHRRIST